METHVMLRHPRGLQNRNRITDVVSNVLEIEDMGIVVVLPREENKREICWMDVCQETVVVFQQPNTGPGRCHAPSTFGTVNMECTVDSRLSWSER